MVVYHKRYGTRLNNLAMKSLDTLNDAGHPSLDEAISIHELTASLSSFKINIIYEGQISSKIGKPDYMLRLGKDVVLFVSVTRAFHLKYNNVSKSFDDLFSPEEAIRLMKKKMSGLEVCMQREGFFLNDVYQGKQRPSKVKVIPVLHVLVPSSREAIWCRDAFYANPNHMKVKLIITQTTENIFRPNRI